MFANIMFDVGVTRPDVFQGPFETQHFNMCLYEYYSSIIGKVKENRGQNCETGQIKNSGEICQWKCEFGRL